MRMMGRVVVMSGLRTALVTPTLASLFIACHVSLASHRFLISFTSCTLKKKASYLNQSKKPKKINNNFQCQWKTVI
jgi:hypothetical protein